MVLIRNEKKPQVPASGLKRGQNRHPVLSAGLSFLLLTSAFVWHKLITLVSRVVRPLGIRLIAAEHGGNSSPDVCENNESDVSQSQKLEQRVNTRTSTVVIGNFKPKKNTDTEKTGSQT